MQVKDLIDILKRFDDEAEVRFCIGWPGRVVETFDQIWVGDYGCGPELIAAPQIWGSSVYAGFGLEQLARPCSRLGVDLGRYPSRDDGARVQDFYVVHRKLNEPLNFPDFDYEHWIPPRTVSGQYNEHIARILREKLLKDS